MAPALDLENISEIPVGWRNVGQQQLAARVVTHANIHFCIFDFDIQLWRVFINKARGE